MRIIRKGEVEIECPKCHTLMGATASDIGDNDVFEGYDYTVSCPSCKRFIRLQSGQIPHWMQMEISKRTNR